MSGGPPDLSQHSWEEAHVAAALFPHPPKFPGQADRHHQDVGLGTEALLPWLCDILEVGQGWPGTWAEQISTG